MQISDAQWRLENNQTQGGVLDLIETIVMSSRRVQFSTMPLGKSIGRKEARVGRYLVSLAPPRVRALFAAARQWERALEFPVDGGPCCGALAEIIVHYCRAGMRNHPKPKPGQSGYDCRDAQGRRVQIKAIGHGKPWFQFTIDPSQAERLIVLRIYDASWDVIYDGPTKPIRGGSAMLHDPNKIVVLKTELSQLAKPHAWERFWHVSGTSKA